MTSSNAPAAENGRGSPPVPVPVPVSVPEAAIIGTEPEVLDSHNHITASPPIAPVPNATAIDTSPNLNPNPTPDLNLNSNANIPSGTAGTAENAPMAETTQPSHENITTTTTANTTTTSTNTNSPTDTNSGNQNLKTILRLNTNFDIDHTIPSPPTVSPLSTPAATHVNIDDIDERIDDSGDQQNSSHASNLRNKLRESIQQPVNGTAESSDWNNPTRSSAAHPSDFSDASAMMMNATHTEFPAFHPLGRPQNRFQAIATTDPEPESANYSSHNNLNTAHPNANVNVDPSTLMMALAQASSNQYNNHVDLPMPNHIAPSDVSLGASFTQESDAVTGSLDPTSASASQKLESFARLEFADSVFQMTTYAVIVGRDQRAMNQARRAEKREQLYKKKVDENARLGLPPPTPLNFDRGKFSKSYVSEEGGMLGPESDGEENVLRPVKKRRNSPVNRSEDGDDDGKGGHITSNRQYVSHTPGAAAVDLGHLRPSPEHIPFLGIHSPGPDIAKKTRGISRQHLKIQFNQDRGAFEAISLHRNGFFIEDRHQGLDNPPVILKSGTRLQVKDVAFAFIINGVEYGKTGGEDDADETSSKRLSIGGKEMSFDFEHSDHENFQDTSEDLTPPPAEVKELTPLRGSDDDEDDEELELEQEQEQDQDQNQELDEREQDDREVLENFQALVAATGALDDPHDLHDLHDLHDPHDDGLVETTEFVEGQQSEFMMSHMPKRRGPGRPPKDGIMSKRERRLLKKQLQETSKKTLPQEPLGEKIKRPVGRPRKNPAPEDGEKMEKRKYTKRKREDGEEGSDVEKRVKEKKDKKVRPKSPPLDLNKEDFTEEQLQKPSKNYGVLIDEALTNGPLEGLTLKQIYKRIMQKYPWFYFSAETKGWESSVRHNLIGNEAFKKSEITGLWSRVPGVELDAGKKRKPSSPDRQLGPSHPHLSHLAHQPYYQGGSYMSQQNAHYTHGTAAQQSQTTYQTTSYPTPAQPVAQAVAPAQLPLGYGASPLSRTPGVPQQSTYSSPYARPPPPPNPPIKPETSTLSSPQSLTPGQSQPTQSQPSQQPSQQAVSGGTNAVNRLALTPEIERAITQFKANMLNNLSKHTKHAVQIIDTAIHKVKGLPAQDPVPGFESIEKALIDGLQTMIKNMQGGRQTTTSASPAPATHAVAAKSTPTRSSTPAAAADEEIQRRIKSFRDNIIGRLEKKTDQAEAIVDSAINRAKGLPSLGNFKGWEEADRLMYESVTKIISDVRKAHGLGPQPTAPISTTSQPQPTSLAQPAPQPMQKAPSASPAPGQPLAYSIAAQQSNGTALHGPATSPPPSVATPASNSMSPSITRPSPSIPRPGTIGITRPSMGSIARPPVSRPEPGIPSPAPPKSTPAPTPNVSSPAPPSAGVVSQIANSQQRSSDDMARKVSSPAPPSAGVLDQIAGQKRAMDTYHSEAKERPAVTPAVSAAPTVMSAAPAHTPSSHRTNPTTPSAGVLAQITGQRSAENTPKAVPTPTPAPAPTVATPTPTMAAPPTPKVAPPAPLQPLANSGSVSTPAALPTATAPSATAPPAAAPSTATPPAVALPAAPPTVAVPPVVAPVAVIPAAVTPPVPQPQRASVSGQTSHQPQPASGTTNIPTSTSTSASSPNVNATPSGQAINQPQEPTNSASKPVSPSQPLAPPAPSLNTTASERVISEPQPTSDLAKVSLAPVLPPSPGASVVNQAAPQKQPQVAETPALSPPLPPPQRGPSQPQPKAPSAGVVEQIVGQKRTLDDGPGDDQSTQQPEPKKLAVSPT